MFNRKEERAELIAKLEKMDFVEFDLVYQDAASCMRKEEGCIGRYIHSLGSAYQLRKDGDGNLCFPSGRVFASEEKKKEWYDKGQMIAQNLHSISFNQLTLFELKEYYYAGMQLEKMLHEELRLDDQVDPKEFLQEHLYALEFINHSVVDLSMDPSYSAIYGTILAQGDSAMIENANYTNCKLVVETADKTGYITIKDGVFYAKDALQDGYHKVRVYQPDITEYNDFQLSYLYDRVLKLRGNRNITAKVSQKTLTK